MKKLFSYFVLGIITIPFIGDESKADYIIDAGTTWTFDGSIKDSSSGPNGDTRTLDNDLNCESKKSYSSAIGSGDASAHLCIRRIIEKQITNSSNTSSNTSNINSLGEGVAGSTALTAALSALPHTSKESKLSCGVGSGTNSSKYAVGFGCASKISERVDVNVGGSYVFGGSKSYGGGTLDNGVARLGFAFKLGELNKPTQISFNDKKIIDKKISNLVKENQNLKDKNDEIISQNQKLLARLEKLENIALKLQSSPEMISVATKD